MTPTYSLLRSKTFWTLVVGFLYQVWQLAMPSVPAAATGIIDAIFLMLGSYFHLQTGQSTTGSN